MTLSCQRVQRELAGKPGWDGRGICSGNVSLSFKEKEFGRNRGLYFQLIKTDRVIEGAGSPEVLMARLCLVSAGRGIESGSSFVGIETRSCGR